MNYGIWAALASGPNCSIERWTAKVIALAMESDPGCPNPSVKTPSTGFLAYYKVGAIKGIASAYQLNCRGHCKLLLSLLCLPLALNFLHSIITEQFGAHLLGQNHSFISLANFFWASNLGWTLRLHGRIVNAFCFLFTELLTIERYLKVHKLPSDAQVPSTYPLFLALTQTLPVLLSLLAAIYT